MTYIEGLPDAIRNLHGCESVHIESVPVKEVFEGKTVWDGQVEDFQLSDLPKAKRCYGWAHATGEKGQGAKYITVLEVPPVNSPAAAVRAATVDELQRTRRSECGG